MENSVLKCHLTWFYKNQKPHVELQIVNQGKDVLKWPWGTGPLWDGSDVKEWRRRRRRKRMSSVLKMSLFRGYRGSRLDLFSKDMGGKWHIGFLPDSGRVCWQKSEGSNFIAKNVSGLRDFQKNTHFWACVTHWEAALQPQHLFFFFS